MQFEFQVHPWIKIVKVEVYISSCNAEHIHCKEKDIDAVFYGNSREKGVEVIFHHEEILEDYLDTEFDIRFWEEEIGNGNYIR